MDQSTEAKRDDSTPVDLLRRLKQEVYYDETEALAEGLGRTTEEIEAWLDGSEEIDEDGEMKIHGLAQERLSE
jgi:hypothetical protein